MAASEMGGSTVEELEALMKEFPDWKEQFPGIYKDICPPRYSKINGKKDAFPVGSDRIIKKRSESFPNTDYKNTFKKHKAYRPRSTKRPPPSPCDPCPPPMVFDTNQRREFTPKDLNVRPNPVKMDEQYQAPDGKFEAFSCYHRDFPARKILPEIRFAAGEPGLEGKKPHPLTSTCKFDHSSLSHDHYKPWHSAPVKPFSELPSFTGSILYPGRDRAMETTSNNTFKGAPGKRAELVKLSGGNIELDGDMDLNTTSRLTFKGFEAARPAQKIVAQPMIISTNRVKFDDQTQSKSDFPGYKGRQPKPPKPVEPAPETIDLKFDNKQEFGTEQRRQFPGVDPKDHPVPKSCKKDSETYKPPQVKFEVTSSQKRDYQPIDIQENYKIPVKPVPVRDRRNLPKLDDTTMNKQFFQKWEIPARVRYGDFHEGHSYVPPAEKFNAKTTNQDVFVGNPGEIPRSFKPEDKTIEKEGTSDFNTMYRVTFKQPEPAKLLDKKQASLLLRELRKRKTERAVATCK